MNLDCYQEVSHGINLMKKLTQALRQEGIDSTSLRLFFTADEEKIYRLAVGGGVQAIAAWQQLRDLAPQTGYWPILVGDREELEHIQENLEDFEDLFLVYDLAERISRDLINDWVVTFGLFSSMLDRAIRCRCS